MSSREQVNPLIGNTIPEGTIIPRDVIAHNGTIISYGIILPNDTSIQGGISTYDGTRNHGTIIESTIKYNRKRFPSHIPDYTVENEFETHVQDEEVSNIITLKFDYGVAIAANTLLPSNDIPQLKQVGKYTIVGGSAFMKDFQYLCNLLIKFETECEERGNTPIKPKSVNNYIARVIHEYTPIKCDIIIVGMQDGEPYIGTADLSGSHEADAFVVGTDAHYIQPLIRSYITGNDDALECTRECTRLDVDHIRTCLAELNSKKMPESTRVEILTITAEGVHTST